MHQAEVVIGVVEVQVRALALLDDEAQAPRLSIPSHRHGPTPFDRTEDANQAVGDLVALLNCSRPVFFREARRLQVFDRPPRVRRHLGRMRLHAGGEVLGERRKVLQQDVATAQPDLGPFRMLIERNVPRHNMRSNPVKIPAMRSWYRVTNRSIGSLLDDVWWYIHHPRIPMG